MTDRTDVPNRHSQPFGHAMLPYFKLADGYVNLNHGSFGAVPREVIEAQRKLLDEAESLPDSWYRGGYQAILQEVRANIAKYVNADPKDVVFVENTSTGVNSVLRTLSPTMLRGGSVLLLSTAYPMVPNTVKYLGPLNDIDVVTVNITFPLQSPDTIVDRVREVLASEEGQRVRLAIFSHITSLPAVLLPIEQLAAVCKSHNVSVLVDGAHALGQIPIDMRALQMAGVDYYVANGHKWLFSPKGTAILWAAPAVQDALIPTVVSVAGKLDFVGTFEFTGTRDYTAFCAIGAALAFRESLGDARIMAYNRDLAVWTSHYLAEHWGTEAVIPDSMIAAMANARLPSNDVEAVNAMQQKLFQEHKIYIVVYPLQGQCWARISTQIYIEKEDIIRTAALVKELLKPSS